MMTPFVKALVGNKLAEKYVNFTITEKSLFWMCIIYLTCYAISRFI